MFVVAVVIGVAATPPSTAVLHEIGNLRICRKRNRLETAKWIRQSRPFLLDSRCRRQAIVSKPNYKCLSATSKLVFADLQLPAVPATKRVSI